MNVMLTSVGRRAYMVKYFKEVLGNDGKVYHTGYVIGGLWLNVYEITPMMKEA